MAEEKRTIITFNGKEVKEKQLLTRRYKSGKVEYIITHKKVSIVIHSNGTKNIIAIENQYGNIIWAGTYTTDTQLQSINIVVFNDDYMMKFNNTSVVAADGKRFIVPNFHYFETELIPESSANPWINAEDEEIDYDVDEDELTAEEIAKAQAQAEQIEVINEVVTELRERSGLTE